MLTRILHLVAKLCSCVTRITRRDDTSHRYHPVKSDEPLLHVARVETEHVALLEATRYEAGTETPTVGTGPEQDCAMILYIGVTRMIIIARGKQNSATIDERAVVR